MAYPPPPLPPQREKAYFHEGFYFRFGFGVGSMSGTVANAEVADSSDLDISGFATVGELAFGGTPTPGFALGGGIFGANVPTVTIDDDFESGAGGISIIGFFIDYYPAPDKGLHVQGAIGPALISAAEGDELGSLPDDYFGAGVGVTVGVGYEGWIGKEWGMGGLLRLLYANGTITPTDTDSYADLDVETLVPGVLLTFTCH
jgi:hypothetical protein